MARAHDVERVPHVGLGKAHVHEPLLASSIVSPGVLSATRFRFVANDRLRHVQRRPRASTKVHCSPSRANTSRRVASGMCPNFEGRNFDCGREVFPSRSFSSFATST